MDTSKKNTAAIYPANLFEKLEFDFVLEKLNKHCSSVLGAQQVNQIQFNASKEVIQTWLNQVAEFQLLFESGESFPSENYHQLREELDRLQLDGAILSEEELFRIYQFLNTVNLLFHFFQKRFELYPNLFSILKDFTFNKLLLNAIKDIIDDNGRIKSNASPELMRLRKQSTAKFQELDRKFKTVMNEYAGYGFLTPEKESIRASRRVLSVLSEYKRKVNGLILDESATGKTTFIEPDAVMQINNDLMEIQQAEKREIYKILKNITHTIRPHAGYLAQFQSIVGTFDFIKAKALYAKEINAIIPELSDEKLIDLRNAYHPVLRAINKSKKKKTIPLNLFLHAENKMMVISGPNAGGKSVALKTVGLLQLMLQCGLPIPVEEGSTISLFNQLFVDIGDEQSLENDLSTYSSRLTNMKYFLTFANAKTLVLIDELGSGTDPSVGGPIGETILENLYDKNVFAIVTTHFSNLKIWASKKEGVESGAMSFNQIELHPNYELVAGKPGSSFAFELAQKIGLQKSIIEDAKTKMDQGIRKFDELLNTLETERQQIAAKEKALKEQEKKYDNLLAEYKIKKDKLLKYRQQIKEEYLRKANSSLEEKNKRFEALIKKWQEDKNNKESIRKFKEEVANEKGSLKTEQQKSKQQKYERADKKGEVKVGSLVRLLVNDKRGTVLELRKNAAIVQFGAFKTKVALNEIVGAQEQFEQASKSKIGAAINYVAQTSNFEQTIDVRGRRPEEAMEEVEKFVDQALMLDVDSVKILHGKGSGVLRQSVRSLLKGINAVDSFKDELPEFGGDGITIVSFK